MNQISKVRRVQKNVKKAKEARKDIRPKNIKLTHLLKK